MDEKIRTLFSANLKRLLSSRGKNQADMCKYMKISSATASDWCNGKKIPRTDKLRSLCTWLDCELDDLIGEKDVAPVPFDPKKEQLNKLYDSLNEDGRDMLLEMARMLPSQERYRRAKDSEGIG